jgi:hypothetical protein
MRRRVVVLAGLLAVLVIGLLVAFRASVRLLRTEIVGVLGPGAQIGALEVGIRRLAVDDLVLPGTERWPADAALRAQKVEIAPSLLSLLSRQIRIASVEVETPYVSMVRTRRGKLRIVPTLLGRQSDKEDTDGPRAAARRPASRPPAPKEPGAPEVAARVVTVGRITISKGAVDLYDASVAQPPWRIQLVGVDASVESVTAPTPHGRSPLDVRATIDGPSRDGTVTVSGWVDPETKDLDLTARLQGVDLLTFQPYVVRSTTARLSSGAFDLDLHATVRDGHLNAPGHLVLSSIAFAGGSDRVLGVPRDLLLAALAEKNGRIALDFTLSGDVNDPRFSLNEALATQVATALVDALGGVSVPGLVTGVGKLGGTTLKGADEVGKGVGAALKGLLRGR